MTRRGWILLSVSIVIGFLLLIGLVGSVCFFLGRANTEREWSRKLQPHTPVEMRGLVNAMSKYASEPPNFLPLSTLDDEVCAAAVTNAVNYIVGEERLESTSAWLYSKVNAAKLQVVYDRSKDFQIQDNKIVEVKDRGFNLTQLLDPSGIYILGYHYRQTRSDHKILAAGADLNSHVMLLLGHNDATWVGYHMIHYTGEGYTNPVKVEAIVKMPALLDLVYIWQVKGIVLPKEGKDLFLANSNLPYSRLAPWLDNGPDSLEYVLDTAVMYLVTKFTRTSQFPTVIDLENREIVELKHRSSLYHGLPLGFYKRVPIYYNRNQESVRGTYGLEFECVELANRFLVSKGHRNLTRTWHADSYFWGAELKGLRKFPQGSKEKPQPDDLLVFDASDHDGQPGHVAVIYEVADDYVCFVQQNVGKTWRDCLPLRFENEGWHISLPEKKVEVYPPVAGWSRIDNSVHVKSPKPSKRGAK
ncbi:MAG: hypothetical protein UT32_C0028G0031 [Parcubacteria group bacterium GW2011_GWC2_39_14]|nr:MAG: hypothetical protein UT32_C0028G0031 [Parcubacteria group bacterium GW2011_GWC2_39_14]